MSAIAINIIIADDDQDALDLLAHQLKGCDFNLHMYKSAEELLTTLHSQPKGFDVVLLDMNMHGGMSGLDCLKIIKASEAHRYLPVILQTSENNSKIITDALEAGAFYFLEKTTERKIIQAVIYSAMENKVRFHDFENERRTLKSGLQYIENAQFCIRTLAEMDILTALLTTAYPDPNRVSIGIHELLTNAIEHGNLNITYDGKSKLILENKWNDEIKKRLASREHKNKTVEVHIKKTTEQIILTITDQGNGFNCKSYLEIDPCRLFDPHGRGIAVAKSMSFDELTYVGKGNQVVAVVNL